MKENKEKIRLLLVDDEEEFLTSTARALSRRGFEVKTAQNGNVALKFLENETFDVTILDVKMPGIPGDQLFKEIKKQWPTMPMIMLTGHGTVQQAFQTSREGVFDYLTKPCDVEKLVRVAQNAVAAYKKKDSSDSEKRERAEVRLLIVDDDSELLESLSSALSRRGMLVATAQSSTNAYDLINKRLFDVALLDVKMPLIDGVTLLCLVKKVLPFCEVILYTGHPSVEVETKGIEYGAFDFIVKPQDPDKLADTIRKAFHRSLSRLAEAERERVD